MCSFTGLDEVLKKCAFIHFTPTAEGTPLPFCVEFEQAVVGYYGVWPMVRRKAVLGRYTALRCLWHEIRDDERSNR
eukprot:910206-Prymnesium_polylepis.2